MIGVVGIIEKEEKLKQSAIGSLAYGAVDLVAGALVGIKLATHAQLRSAEAMGCSAAVRAMKMCCC